MNGLYVVMGIGLVATAAAPLWVPFVWSSERKAAEKKYDKLRGEIA
jgi:hypothetical protein